MKLIGEHREVLGDVGGRGGRDSEQLRDLASDVLLHLGEPVPAAYQRLAPPPCRRDVKNPVTGDRMVHGRHHRQAEFRDLQQPGAEALVVMDHVEVLEAVGQRACGAKAERLRFGESRGPGRQQLEQVDARLDLGGPRDAERVRLPVEVEAGHFGQAHPRIEAAGVGLAREHLDVVAEFDETPGQVADVDPLPATVGLAPVRQQRDTHVQLTPTRTGGQVQGR